MTLLFTVIFMSKPLMSNPIFLAKYLIYNWCANARLFGFLAKNERLSSVLRDWQYRGLREANSLKKIYEIVSLEKPRTTLIRGQTVKQSKAFGEHNVLWHMGQLQNEAGKKNHCNWLKSIWNRIWLLLKWQCQDRIML